VSEMKLVMVDGTSIRTDNKLRVGAGIHGSGELMADLETFTWDAAAALGKARRHRGDNPELEREQKIALLRTAREYINLAINQLTEGRK